VLLELVKKIKQKYVLLILAQCVSATSFDLWKSKGAHYIFALAVNFLGKDWMPKHITIG
jgi:hypothetical protein